MKNKGLLKFISWAEDYQKHHPYMTIKEVLDKANEILDKEARYERRPNLLTRFKCFIFKHDYVLVQWFGIDCQRVKCKRCDQHFGINHSVKSMLPWDHELEHAMRVAYPENFDLVMDLFHHNLSEYKQQFENYSLPLQTRLDAKLMIREYNLLITLYKKYTWKN